MKIRFKRYGRIEQNITGITPRRLAAARRALQAQRDKLPLLAGMIAETQPTPEERINKVDAGLIAQMVEKRQEIAGKWREIRRKLRAMDPEERNHLLWYWNRSAMPADAGYMTGFLHRWIEQGWRPEARNDEEDQRIWAAGRVRLAVLFERWHKEGRKNESPLDLAATRGVHNTPAEWRPAILGKMVVEEIQDLTDGELTRIFTGSADPARSLDYAKQLIAEGSITMNDIAEAAKPATRTITPMVLPPTAKETRAANPAQLTLFDHSGQAA